MSREARSQQRRMLTALGDEFGDSELLKFNQLKFRRKAMMFGKQFYGRTLWLSLYVRSFSLTWLVTIPHNLIF